MQVGVLFWPLIAIGAAAAIAYGLWGLAMPASLAKAALKTSFMGAVTAAFWGAPLPLVLALGFSAAGDLFLAFDRKWALPLGLLFFLMAQLCYVVVFFFIWLFSGDNAPLAPRYAAMAAIGAFVVCYLAWLWPKLGLMGFGVVPYALTITAMAMMSAWMPWRGWPAMLGAFLFVASDGVLAAELFRLAPDSPARGVTSPIVWWTYAAAQGLILWGITRATSDSVI